VNIIVGEDGDVWLELGKIHIRINREAAIELIFEEGKELAKIQQDPTVVQVNGAHQNGVLNGLAKVPELAKPQEEPTTRKYVPKPWTEERRRKLSESMARHYAEKRAKKGLKMKVERKEHRSRA
jgi:hypothetical protein